MVFSCVISLCLINATKTFSEDFTPLNWIWEAGGYREANQVIAFSVLSVLKIFQNVAHKWRRLERVKIVIDDEIDDGDIDEWLEKFIDIRSVKNYSHYHCHAQTEDTNNKDVETSLHHRVVLEPGLHLPVLHAGVAGHEEVGED